MRQIGPRSLRRLTADSIREAPSLDFDVRRAASGLDRQLTSFGGLSFDPALDELRAELRAAVLSAHDRPKAA